MIKTVHSLFHKLRAFIEPERFLREFYNKAKFSAPTFILSFDVDLERDVKNLPYLLDELARRDLIASFAIVGQWVQRFPDIHRLLKQAKHEIINHTFSHPDNIELSPKRSFARLSYSEKKEEIIRAHEIIHDTIGYDSKGFRVPHFGNLYTRDIYPILDELGYRFSSSTISTRVDTYGQPFTADSGIVEFPIATCPRHPFSSFDSWHSVKRPKTFLKPSAFHRGAGEFRKLFQLLMEWVIEFNIYMSLYFDPGDIAEKSDMSGILDDMVGLRDKVRISCYSLLVDKIKETSNIAPESHV